MEGFAIIVVVLAAVLLAGLARRYGLPAPLVVLAVGLGVSYIPSLNRVEVHPDLLLGIVLPPLLYSAALSSSLQDFRASFSPILRLGVGAVIVTTVAVAGITLLIEPGYSIPAALLLGAIVAPPDAVAAMAVGRKVGLPRRLMTLLGGESLINDATSLTLFKVALAAAGATGTLWSVGARAFALAVVCGVGVGLALAWATQLARASLRDPAVDTVLGLLLPFVSWWLAEEVHGSGVLAVVAAGFYIGQSSIHTTVSTRLHEEPIWASIDLLLESFTFALIGLQLRWVIQEVQVSPTENTGKALGLTGAVVLTTLLIRPIYIYATEFLASLPIGPRRQVRTRMDWRDLLVTSWAGMRGVVTLAAAAAIPVRADNGELIPGRPTLQLAAYAVAIITLLLQGLSLPTVIRALKISSEDEEVQDQNEEARCRLLAARSAAEVVAGHVAQWSEIMGPEQARQLARRTTQVVLAREAAAATLLRPDWADHVDLDEEIARHLPAVATPEAAAAFSLRTAALRTEMIQAQRAVVIRESRAGHLNDTVMRRMLRELDLEEESMEASWTSRL
ncbi:MAG: cation:proton antiporter [Micrococcales bacterium]|nr:cation:proton antiporter [Micrococcales bacterium]